MSEVVTYAGGCHCGAVRFEVDVDDHVVVDCNCSICTKKGILHLIVPPERFRLLCGADALATYSFGTHTAKHRFCTTCGIHPFYTPRSHPDHVDVNARCLDGHAWQRFSVQPFNGVDWEESVADLRSDIAR